MLCCEYGKYSKIVFDNGHLLSTTTRVDCLITTQLINLKFSAVYLRTRQMCEFAERAPMFAGSYWVYLPLRAGLEK